MATPPKRHRIFARVWTVVTKGLGEVVGFLLIVAGSLSVLALGFFLFYDPYSQQLSGTVALASCVCWFLAYSIYETIRLADKPKKPHERSVPQWTFTPRNICMIMTLITGLVFGVLVLLWFNISFQFLVIAPFILFFPFSYMAYSAFKRPVRIKRLRSDFELLTAQWDETLYQQSTSFFNYALHITLAILVTLLGLIILFMPLFGLETMINTMGLTNDILRAMGIGFLGSYLFSMYYIYQRYTTSDLLPPVYLYCAITIIFGLAFNYVVFHAFQSISPSLIDVLSFSVGFFPSLAIQWLTQTVYKTLRQSQRRSDLFRMDQLDGISQAHEIRLRDFGIDDAQNLASTEIPQLLISTPFPVQTVVDWVDQAVLMVLLNDEKTLGNFRSAHIRTMTDFRDLWGPNIEKYHSLKRIRDAAVDKSPANGTVAAIDVKLQELSDEQKEIATMLQSDVPKLNALYSSTNFDMNIPYLNNYRKNIELLLPGWASARFNRYLIEAYELYTNDPNTERKTLARLWNFVNTYLEVNELLNQAHKVDPDDDSMGMVVKPSSVEAHIGLARLYLHNANECVHHAEKEKYQQLADNEYNEAVKQILSTSKCVINLKAAINVPKDVHGWTLIGDAATQALQEHVTQWNMSSNKHPNNSKTGAQPTQPVQVN